jgi:hypothetical protein
MGRPFPPRLLRPNFFCGFLAIPALIVVHWYGCVPTRRILIDSVGRLAQASLLIAECYDKVGWALAHLFLIDREVYDRLGCPTLRGVRRVGCKDTWRNDFFEP